jgi:hypothetical protein
MMVKRFMAIHGVLKISQSADSTNLAPASFSFVFRTVQAAIREEGFRRSRTSAK